MKWAVEHISSTMSIYTARTPLGHYTVRNDRVDGVSCGFYPQSHWTMARYCVYNSAQDAINACEKHWDDIVQKIIVFQSECSTESPGAQGNG